jgi:hypothetical protein
MLVFAGYKTSYSLFTKLNISDTLHA